ncbi:uncharacterized protein MONOS_13938 [Monocercomonoides exilis]|uniref:uncharacterized protein n=1 Tax=Monocercomonoides exilis TaxID=2049356 RepID=UPI003559C6B8|nr:hypothetical protein MONOS_13938 [Monocercomonoides exilis]|eukprot:MONOS_13938.1-p1 / transcript=MONOS_13938.1 / gene=MONOS_13938 / organism=Monocercomonoides_exilis_PA203 / gene_product=unspecified product / transcript_product=unspecified product / location=Mono_scaffold00907:6346-8334(-) / protein_length=662 / sequence_SO=supercontig / SO=protein_coding / is_pseudo=false
MKEDNPSNTFLANKHGTSLLSATDIYGPHNENFIPPLSVSTSPSMRPILNPIRNEYESPTRLSKALRCCSKDSIKEYLEPGLQFSEDRRKTHRWIFSMYTQFCEVMEYDPWPLSEKPAYGFIKLMGIALQYSISTIRDDVISSLKAISRSRTNSPVPEAVSHKMLVALKEVKLARKRHCLSEAYGKKEKEEAEKWKKEPLIVPDLCWILQCIPDWCIEKPREASLFLFAISTGARSHTCSHIKLRDIARVYVGENSTMMKVTINLVHVKGMFNDDHCVTVEGDITQKQTLNVVYWLEQFLVEEYGLSLTLFDEWKLGDLGNQFIWGIRKGAMRKRLQKRASQAGYPENIFGFHSLRSGFICSALLKIGNHMERKESVLETTAIIGRWDEGSECQRRYIKKAEKGTIVANRIILPDEVVESDEPFEKDLSTPCVFHNIKLKEVEWNNKSIIDSFNFIVLEYIKFSCSRLFYPYSCVNRLNNIAANRFLKNRSITKPKDITSIKYSRTIICEDLLSESFDIIQIVHQYLKGIEDYLDGKVPMIFSEPKIKPKLREQRAINPLFNRPARIMWTPSEDKILMEKFLEGISFKEIATQLPNRSPNSCRDRIRNIIRIQKRNDKFNEETRKAMPDEESNIREIAEVEDDVPVGVEEVEKMLEVEKDKA